MMAMFHCPKRANRRWHEWYQRADGSLVCAACGSEIAAEPSGETAPRAAERAADNTDDTAARAAGEG